MMMMMMIIMVDMLKLINLVFNKEYWELLKIPNRIHSI